MKFLTELTENGLFIPQDKGNHLLETTASDLHASCFAPSPSREELASADWKRDINGYRLGFLATVLGRDVPPGVRSELESVLEKVYVTCLKYSESWDIKDEFYVNADAIMLSLKLYFKAVSNFKAASNQETVTRIACSLARKIIGPDGQISISDGSMRKTALELLNEAKKILPENARIQYAGTDIDVAFLVDKVVSALEGRIVQRGSAAQEAIDSDA